VLNLEQDLVLALYRENRSTFIKIPGRESIRIFSGGAHGFSILDSKGNELGVFAETYVYGPAILDGMEIGVKATKRLIRSEDLLTWLPHVAGIACVMHGGKTWFSVRMLADLIDASLSTRANNKFFIQNLGRCRTLEYCNLGDMLKNGLQDLFGVKIAHLTKQCEALTFVTLNGLEYILSSKQRAPKTEKAISRLRTWFITAKSMPSTTLQTTPFIVESIDSIDLCERDDASSEMSGSIISSNIEDGLGEDYGSLDPSEHESVSEDAALDNTSKNVHAEVKQFCDENNLRFLNLQTHNGIPGIYCSIIGLYKKVLTFKVGCAHDIKKRLEQHLAEYPKLEGEHFQAHVCPIYACQTSSYRVAELSLKRILQSLGVRLKNVALDGRKEDTELFTLSNGMSIDHVLDILGSQSGDDQTLAPAHSSLDHEYRMRQLDIEMRKVEVSLDLAREKTRQMELQLEILKLGGQLPNI
jgi:hypothetical protein